MNPFNELEKLAQGKEAELKDKARLLGEMAENELVKKILRLIVEFQLSEPCKSLGLQQYQEEQIIHQLISNLLIAHFVKYYRAEYKDNKLFIRLVRNLTTSVGDALEQLNEKIDKLEIKK